MSYRTDIAYFYDGSFEGLLCCVFVSFSRREDPALILPLDHAQGVLFDTLTVETDPQKAQRVLRSIPQKLGPEALELVQCGFLSDLEEKERTILQFLRLGYAVGPKVTRMLTQEPVCILTKAVQRAKHEAHQWTGFLRFSDTGEVLAAVIEPKNMVLPLLAGHFCARFSGERFFIYDQTHRMALIHEPGRAELIPVEDVTLPPPNLEERESRALWRRFYDTIAVQGRYNPNLRRSNMPKWYWANMTEFLTDPEPEQPALTLPQLPP